jgi:hypothetical protein
VAVLSLAGVAAAAEGATGRYQGNTSQGRPISFSVSNGRLAGLQFSIDVICPSHRVWKVTAAVSAPVKIVDSRFDQTFNSQQPGAQGVATVKGSVRRSTVSGTLTMKRYIAKEHHYCSGTATFSVNHPSRRESKPAHRVQHHHGASAS